MFTPIRLTAVACYASGHLKVRLSLKNQNLPPPPPKPFHKHRYRRRHLVIAHFSQLTNTVLTLLALIVAYSGVHCGFTVGWNINTGLWSKNSSLTRKVVSGVLYPYKSDKSNAQKLEILTNINVYSYGRAHRSASCSAGVICRGCGVVTCNTQPSIYFKLLGTPEYLEFIQLSHRSCRFVLLSL